MKPFAAVYAAIAVAATALPGHTQTKVAAMDNPVILPSSLPVLWQGMKKNVPTLAAIHPPTLLQHKATVLVFVANRCGVTWLYADKLAALLKEYGGSKNVAIVGVHSNVEESDAEIVKELKRRKISLPVLDDKPTQRLADYFGASVTPYFVVIDQKGVLRYKGPYDKMGGSMPESKRPQYLRPALDAVLAGKPVAQKNVRALGCEIARRPVSKNITK